MPNTHPYLQAYIKTNCKFNKILKHYKNIQKQNTIKTNQNAGGGNIITEIDNFIFEENEDETRELAKAMSRTEPSLREGLKPSQEEDERISIFIGKRYECVIAFIDKQTSHLVWLEYFSYNQNCNINKNLLHGEGTFNMMTIFIKYIKQKHPEIQIIKLTDKSEFICSSIRISLYKLYMLKYGNSFYEKKFGFVLDKTNHPDIIRYHKQNIEISKTIRIDTEFIRQELQKLLEIKNTLFKTYLTPEIIKDFTSHLRNEELVRDFLLRYKIPDDQCAIFEDFLDIIFGNYNLDISIISTGGIYVKNIYSHKTKKLTKERPTSNINSSRSMDKLSLKHKT